jgi:hypothetical protein
LEGAQSGLSSASSSGVWQESCDSVLVLVQYTRGDIGAYAGAWIGRASEGSLQHGGEEADLWVLFKASRAWPGLVYKQTIIVEDKQQ